MAEQMHYQDAQITTKAPKTTPMSLSYQTVYSCEQ